MKELILALIIGLGLFLLKMFGQKKEQEMELNSAKIPESVKRWVPELQQAGQEFGVPADIAAAVLWTESAGDQNARGSAGEVGLMQLKDIAVKDLALQQYGDFSNYKTDPVENIRAGVAYLRRWYTVTGNWPAAIKAYNQGYQGSLNKPELAAQYLEAVNSKREFFA